MSFQENVTVISLVFDTPDSKLKRELSARLHLDMNSQNLTLLLQSNTSRFQAHGKDFYNILYRWTYFDWKPIIFCYGLITSGISNHLGMEAILFSALAIHI